ncbi:hypothetical protein BKA65DRAFT_206628 [Rhexocercosporidium sp. MPI-PUGE-AT-0058]|nr:hypothetical protein BKA65DRAFT_206628 [Rhexocercosporidium sp. MPI-PUGE-AT-0058]
MSTQSISDPRTNPTLPADGATATPLENMVSWQSVFFGLAALALNAMTQRSYFDAVFPHSSILFAMRSSPFVCIADLIEVIFVAGHHFMTKQRLQGLPLSSSTDQLPNVGNFAIEGEASFEASSTVGRGHPWVILILFVGTSTQAVKIFGFEGILWAKLWAAAYLLSYVSVALLDILLQPSKRREPIIGRYLLRRSAILNLRIALHIITLAVHMIFFCWAAYRLVHLDLYILQQHPNPVGFWGYLIRSPIIGASAIGALLIFSPLWTLILPLGWAFFRLFRVLEDLQHEREVVGSQSSCGQCGLLPVCGCVTSALYYPYLWVWRYGCARSRFMRISGCMLPMLLFKG